MRKEKVREIPAEPWDKTPMQVRIIPPTDEDGNPITDIKPADKAGSKEK